MEADAATKTQSGKSKWPDLPSNASNKPQAAKHLQGELKPQISNQHSSEEPRKGPIATGKAQTW